MTKKLFTEREFESIYLKATIDSLDSILSSKLLELRGSNSDSTVYFHEKTHQKYFYILFVDFISKRGDRTLIGEKLTCLELISKICKNPKFNVNNSVSELKDAINIFVSWLNEEIVVNIWFPTIDKEFDLKLKRKEFICICANISKHNFTSLTIVSKELLKILKINGIDISFHDSLLVLEDFYERFHDDILIYHGGNITEMLNNIRWGLQRYLLPEFNKSYTKDKTDSREFRYNYIYPKNVKNEFAKNCYWSLMNSIRAKPNLEKFKSTKLLKSRY